MHFVRRYVSRTEEVEVKKIIIASIMIALLLLLSFSATGASEWASRLGILTLQDGESALLEEMLVRQQNGSYIFVTDSWSGITLPVYANTVE